MLASVLVCALLAAPALASDGGMSGGSGGAYGEMEMDGGMDMGCNTTLVEVGLAIPELSTLASFQQRGDDVTDPNSEITVLAPSNDAFASLDADTAAALQAAPELLGPILQLHGILGGFLSTDFTDGMVVPTLSGEELTVGVSDDGITFTSASGTVTKVVQADFIACASVLHVVDTVLLPVEL